MLINNIDISTFKATYLSKDIQTTDITIYDDWLRNALNPLYLSKQEKYKQIKLQLLIKDTDDESSLNDISDLIKQFEKCTIKFDDLSFYYDCLIVNKDHKRIVKGWYTLDVELKSGYAYKAAVTETVDHVASKIITVQGNLPTSAIVTITTPIDTISLTLTGFKDSITINNLLANVPVIIDGEACTVLQSGLNKFMDVDMWSFPVLQSGANTITSSSTNCVITIVYKPKYI
jgi:phage-related protein